MPHWNNFCSHYTYTFQYRLSYCFCSYNVKIHIQFYIYKYIIPQYLLAQAADLSKLHHRSCCWYRILNQIFQDLDTMDLETLTFSLCCTQHDFDISRNEEQKTWEVVFQNCIEFIFHGIFG